MTLFLRLKCVSFILICLSLILNRLSIVLSWVSKVLIHLSIVLIQISAVLNWMSFVLNWAEKGVVMYMLSVIVINNWQYVSTVIYYNTYISSTHIIIINQYKSNHQFYTKRNSYDIQGCTPPPTHCGAVWTRPSLISATAGAEPWHSALVALCWRTHTVLCLSSPWQPWKYWRGFAGRWSAWSLLTLSRWS